MTEEHAAAPLRGRVLASILAVTVLAVTLFAVPLAFAVQRLYRNEAVTALQRDAARVAAVVPDGIPGGPVSLPQRVSPRGASSATVGVYDTAGRRVAGAGPGRSALAAGGHKTQVRDAIEGGDLAVIVPIPSDQKVVGSVRAAEPYHLVTERVYRTWAAMALFAVLAIGLAALLARRQAVRLATPLERLTQVARALGDGDFTVRAERFGVQEADTASQALEDTAVQLGRLLDRERAFSSDVSHQLRTPLTALLVGVESALDRPDADLRLALRDALSRGEHLRTIVDDLVLLVRQPGAAVSPVETALLLEDVRTRWETALAARGRNLVLVVPPRLPRCLASEAAVRQILDVLIGNALWHGDGTVTIEAGESGEGVCIEVSDEGPGFAADPEDLFAGSAERADGHGRGLPLARSLAVASGGNLVAPRTAPRPVFRLVLPASATVRTGAQPAVRPDAHPAVRPDAQPAVRPGAPPAASASKR